MRVLELFSGIGGMHLALKESGINGEIIAAIDINTVANKIYGHNFPETQLLNRNIEGLTASMVNKLQVDTILMSPPCQPFTRNGLQNDMKDPRTMAFKHLLGLLPELKSIENVLVENVKGFDKSDMRQVLIETLEANGFVYQEFLLSPSQIGVPNTRFRYYCLAKRKARGFSFNPTDSLMEKFPSETSRKLFRISDVLQESTTDFSAYFLGDNLLKKRAKILDICHRNSEKSCCFTKGYGRYVEGTGSVFTEQTPETIQEVYNKLQEINSESQEYLNTIKTLGLRYFTPREVCRLMCFPESFQFPDGVTDRQKYMVLGNSINVKVVSELIKLLK